MHDAIILDFDGVIVDSFEIKNHAFKQLFPSEYADTIDIRKGGKSRYEKIHYFYEQVYEKKPTEQEVNRLVEQYSTLTKEKVISCPMLPGAKDFLDKNKGEDTYIVSGTPQGELNEIINKRGLDDYFNEVHGAYEEKDVILKDISKKYENPLYIGDQLSDYEKAQQAGVDFIGIGNKDTFPTGTEVILSLEDLL